MMSLSYSRAVLSFRMARAAGKFKSTDLVCATLWHMGKRQDSRDRIEGQIIELGRRHLVPEGAAGLSLRAIARDLGMVSSAVYRYVASRDELLTLLLVDAYSELADAVARGGEDGGDSGRDRRIARARAARRWAVDQPASWA